MGYGIRGFVGIGRETAWGTAVAATDYVKVLNESLALAVDRFDTVNVHGALAEPDDVAGVRRVEGSVEFAAHPVSMGYFLRSLFVQSSVTVVLSGVLWRTQFRTPTADFSAGECAGRPYTLEIFRDVTSSHRYAGCVVNQLTLGYAPNQDVRITAGFIGRSASLIAATTATFPGSPVHPFTFDTASVQIAGTATARAEALQIAIDSQYEGIPALNNSNEIAKILRRGPQTVGISGTFDFADVAEYLDFVNQTERALRINVTRANSFAFSVEVPRFVYTAFPAQLRGRERVTVDFEGKGFYHAGSGTAIELLLTTTRSEF